MVSPVAATWLHYAWIYCSCCAFLFVPVRGLVGEPTTAAPATTDDSATLEDQLQPYAPDQENSNELEEYSMFSPIKITRSVRNKYDPTYRWLGIGKREPEAPRPKFGKNYKYIGLGKRADGDRKFSPNYKWIGLGKREPVVKFNQGYKWIGLGKRSKRYAPFAASAHLLSQMAQMREFFESSNKNRVSRTSAGGATNSNSGPVGSRPWNPFYSVVTKKYQLETGRTPPVPTGDEDDSSSMEVTPLPVGLGRPNVRGGVPNNFEPIYRFIGLG